MEPTELGVDDIVLRLGVTGRLGEMDFPTVLRALQGGYDLLDRTAHRLLGDRARQLRWQLDGLREGSAMTLVRPTATGDVTRAELLDVVETYTRDLASPAERLPDDDWPVLRGLLTALGATDSGGLLAQVEGDADAVRAELDPATVLPTLNILAPTRHQVIGSVTGRLDGLNVHDKREAHLWNELDRRRVPVTFPEDFYHRVYGALRQRVEVYGIVTEDADGRPLRVRLQDIEVLPRDEDLPTLRSLVGTMPEITGGRTAAEYLERAREELDLG